jgi:hypothetical protein
MTTLEMVRLEAFLIYLTGVTGRAPSDRVAPLGLPKKLVSSFNFNRGIFCCAIIIFLVCRFNFMAVCSAYSQIQ